jgi:hypothetical protein
VTVALTEEGMLKGTGQIRPGKVSETPETWPIALGVLVSNVVGERLFCPVSILSVLPEAPAEIGWIEKELWHEQMTMRVENRQHELAAPVALPGKCTEGGTEHISASAPHPGASAEKTALAIQIRDEAINHYRGPDGYEGDLVDAAYQLEQIGKDAWPALVGLAYSRFPECEFFLGAMVRIEEFSLQDRRQVLLTTAKNPDPNVRSRLLELVEELPADLMRELLGALAAGDSPDDAVTDRARNALTVLESQGR